MSNLILWTIQKPFLPFLVSPCLWSDFFDIYLCSFLIFFDLVCCLCIFFALSESCLSFLIFFDVSVSSSLFLNLVCSLLIFFTFALFALSESCLLFIGILYFWSSLLLIFFALSLSSLLLLAAIYSWSYLLFLLPSYVLCPKTKTINNNNNISIHVARLKNIPSRSLLHPHTLIL